MMMSIPFVLLLAACTTEPEASAPQRIATSPIPATSSTFPIPEASPVEKWKVTTDLDSGVTFALPGTTMRDTQRSSEDGTVPAIRKYNAEVTPDFSLGIGIGESTSPKFAAEWMARIADSIVQQLQAAGSDDVEATHRKNSTMAGLPTLDFRVSFTATTGKRSVWFARVIGNGTQIIQIQTIAFVEPIDEFSATTIIERYHRQLIDSVRL